ncbi:MAG: NUMOD3 domain-containing DNA-binding protein, partial [Methanoregula sp.]|nr:NUMOD3 domain-containing DNA-binding protein [Methanoregula sp.]
MTRGICADPIKELERRRKMSEAWKRRAPASKETCRKISDAMKGHAKSEEHRRKLSEALKGKHPSEETLRKI